jgi:anthranilate phosphoribosyltransferase
MIGNIIAKVEKRVDLTEAEAYEVFGEIMSGHAAESDIKAFLVALRDKGETVGEITGAAKVMRQRSLRVRVKGRAVDTCGTGGSPVKTFNISTTAAFVAAGCSVKIAKHGNRAVSSRCGSADVLEVLGVKVDAGPKTVERCMEEIGIGFMYAPVFHRAMKYAAKPRKEIGTRTIFNILGPLSNPAGASGQVLGVYDASLTGVMAKVLKNLGSKRAFVVHGLDGLDEITITGKTKVTELKGGSIRSYFIAPEKFGIKRARLSDIKGGSAEENAGMALSVLRGDLGPRRNVVLLNAAAAVVAGFKAKDIKEGVAMAADSIDSGRALEKLNMLIELTNKKYV